MPNIRKDKKAAKMYRLYRSGKSLEQVANAFGVTRQSVFVMFTRRNYVMRDRPEPLPFVTFDGFKYTLRNTGYYGKTTGERTLLHRDMWESVNGKIPENHDIHHRDFNKQNNSMSNFELISKSEHASKYAHRRNSHRNLTEEEVLEIRRLRKYGMPLLPIASKFGIAKSTAGNICNRKTWKHI
jgi:DNA-directed RNA polymerase sigma subunit (sigma70/sigma32)